MHLGRSPEQRLQRTLKRSATGTAQTFASHRVVHTGLHLQETLVTLLLRGLSKTNDPHSMALPSAYSTLFSSPVTKEKGNKYLRGRAPKAIDKCVLEMNDGLDSAISGPELTGEKGAHFKGWNNAAEALWPDCA